MANIPWRTNLYSVKLPSPSHHPLLERPRRATAADTEEETKKRERAAHATVLTTLVSIIVSYANGVSDQDSQGKMISNIAPILLTLFLALKTIMELIQDTKIQKVKRENLVEDYKRNVWELSRFVAAGAPEIVDESTQKKLGAQETKEGPEEA